MAIMNLSKTTSRVGSGMQLSTPKTRLLQAILSHLYFHLTRMVRGYVSVRSSCIAD